jgi:lysophospholipase L1-like esterase
MAHPDEHVAEMARTMAHRAPRPEDSLGGAVTAEIARAERSFRRIEPRRRELSAVLALLLLAFAVSVTSSVQWSNAASSNVSAPDLAAYDESPAEPDPSDAAYPFGPLGSLAFDPTFLPPTPSPSPKPTPKPTAPPSPRPILLKPWRFVALGDSLTAWPSDSPWAVRLDARDSHLTLVHNAGVPGDLTSDMRARLQRDVWAYKPAVLFIMGGTNDVANGVSTSTTIANLKAIVVAGKQRHMKVFLMLIPPDSYPRMAPKIQALNEAIMRLGNSQKVVVIDTFSPLATSSGTYIPAYTSDGVHLSYAGAQVVANAVYSRIRRQNY